MTDEPTFEVVVEDPKRGTGSSFETVSAEALRKSLESLSKAVAHSFKSVANGVEGAYLDKVSIHVIVGAEGSVKLLGSGGSTKAEGGIVLTYRFDDDEAK